MVNRGVLLLMVLLLGGCGLEAEFFGPVTDRGHVVVPEPQDTFVMGQAAGFSDGVVRFYTNGAKGPDVDASVEDTGAFVHTLPGTFGAAGVVLWVESGSSVAMAVVPEVIPAQRSSVRDTRERPNHLRIHARARN